MRDEYWLGRDQFSGLARRLHDRTQHEGRPPASSLSGRELEIVEAVLGGATNKDIAAQFGISPQTVKNHLSSIFDKLGVSTRLELALYARHHHLLDKRFQPPKQR
jgi:DNA-binding NarL/FixJ family response regulator